MTFAVLIYGDIRSRNSRHTMTNGRRHTFAISVAAGILGLATATGWGQSAQDGYSYTPVSPPAPPVAAEIQPQAQAYNASDLDQMLGPIALYPDPLLSEVLAAATYPQDVAAAGQW